MQNICFNGCLIWAKASPFACLLDLIDWHIDWHLTKVVVFDLETWPYMRPRFFLYKEITDFHLFWAILSTILTP